MTCRPLPLFAAVACALALSVPAASAAAPPPQASAAQLADQLGSPTGWSQAWDKLLAAGLPAVPELRRRLTAGDSILAIRCAALLHEMGSPEGLPLLAAKLSDENLPVRSLAFAVLRAVAGKDLGYDPAAPAEARKPAADAWSKWVRDYLARKTNANRVVAADNAEGMIILNIGRGKGVQKGDRYSLARGEKFVALVEVVQVLPEVCVARVKARQFPVRLGDIAEKMK